MREFMTLDSYQRKALETDCVHENALVYAVLKLNGEAGEVAELLGKSLRPSACQEGLKHKMLLELGDVLWYVAKIANELGYTLSEVADANLQKLQARKENGTLLERKA